jgi:hypothetical protein
MSKQRKIVPETSPKYAYHKLSDFEKQHVFGEDAAFHRRVFIAIPTTEIPILNENSKSSIVGATGLNFTTEDWRRIEHARQHCAWLYRTEKEAIECDALIARLKETTAAVLVLLNSSPGIVTPAKQRVLDEKHGLMEQADIIAWQRMRDIETPPFDRDEVYPIISQFSRRAHLALERAESEKQQGGANLPTPLQWLVGALCSVFAQKDLPVPMSNPVDHRADAPLALSGILKFVFAVSGTLPPNIQLVPRVPAAAAITKIRRAKNKWKTGNRTFKFPRLS